MQPNNNRTPDQDAELEGNDAGQDAFEPGVSFTDEPSEQSGAGELPSWLQNFAGAAGEPGATASRDESSRSTAPQSQPPAAAPQPRVAEEPAGQFGQLPNSADSSFFSEDDLPEWLRALSTDGEAPAVAAPVAAAAVDSVTPNGAINVPPVSRAWVTASDQPEVSSGANLLSSLVNVIDSRPEAVAIESTLAAPAPQPSAKGASKPQAATSVAPDAAATTTRDAGRWSRTRILAVVAIIVLLLFIIVFLSGN